jgi:hypothetical protein
LRDGAIEYDTKGTPETDDDIVISDKVVVDFVAFTMELVDDRWLRVGADNIPDGGVCDPLR